MFVKIIYSMVLVLAVNLLVGQCFAIDAEEQELTFSANENQQIDVAPQEFMTNLRTCLIESLVSLKHLESSMGSQSAASSASKSESPRSKRPIIISRPPISSVRALRDRNSNF